MYLLISIALVLLYVVWYWYQRYKWERERASVLKYQLDQAKNPPKKQAPPPPCPSRQADLFQDWDRNWQPNTWMPDRKPYANWPEARKQRLYNLIGNFCHDWRIGRKRPKGGLYGYMIQAGIRDNNMKKFLTHNGICTEVEYRDLIENGIYPPSMNNKRA